MDSDGLGSAELACSVANARLRPSSLSSSLSRRRRVRPSLAGRRRRRRRQVLRTQKLREVLSDLPPPALAFDAVGGRAGSNLARILPAGWRVVCVCVCVCVSSAAHCLWLCAIATDWYVRLGCRHSDERSRVTRISGLR